MRIEQLISPIIPTLELTDTGNRALSLMEENNISHLPLIAEQQYKALVHENDVMDWEMPESPLSKADFLNYRPAVFANSHPYDALRIAHQHNLSIVPVIDSSNLYLGSITRHELLSYITESSGLDNPGAIIVLELDPRNYTLVDIARICENEDVAIISTQLRSNSATGKAEITIKTNRMDLRGVISSFERHNYVVKAVYGEQNSDEDMQDRFDLLMNYINM
jgi:CBS domain-containing protein